MTALAKHNTMKICAKNMKEDKLGNTALYPKAGNPQAGAARTAGTNPQPNVSSDGQTPSPAVCSGGQTPCLCPRGLGFGVCWLTKASQSGCFAGQQLKSTAVPGPARRSPAPGVPSRSKGPCFGFPLQGRTSTWGHLAPLLSPLPAPSPGSHPCRGPTVPALLHFLQNASSGDSQIS